jgi:hypothetical protein
MHIVSSPFTFGDVDLRVSFDWIYMVDCRFPATVDPVSARNRRAIIRRELRDCIRRCNDAGLNDVVAFFKLLRAHVKIVGSLKNRDLAISFLIKVDIKFAAIAFFDGGLGDGLN